jgi:putative transposase
LGIRQQYLSYLPTDEGWLYLAAIKDLATREILGWSMADHLRAELCLNALVMALQRHGPPPRGLLHHSDRGVQPGFKQSSQRLPEPIVVARQAPRRAFASQGSCAAAR